MRQFRNISQKELAERLNVAQNTISSWETGRTEPNLGAIDDLCRVFQCQKSDLLDFIAEDPRIDIYLKISVERSGKTNTTVLNNAPVRLNEYWSQILAHLSDDSLKKLADRANELIEIDRLKIDSKKTKK
jgi:transcriptional regulator with XRE-family HTH domain